MSRKTARPAGLSGGIVVVCSFCCVMKKGSSVTTETVTETPSTENITTESDAVTFRDLNLHPVLLKAVLNAGYETPTPIQEQAIPLVLKGHDVMGLAQTGTGKTAAFGLPLINHLMNEHGKPDRKTVKSLILAPTRELVNQIADNLKTYIRGTHLKLHVVVGGASINKQIKALENGLDILVATPGRLIDLLDRRALTLNKARFLVLDEADQMLDLGFIHALRQIAPLLATPRQTMLFSATMPKQMAELSSAYLTNPKRVQVSPPGKAADKIRQSLHFVPQSEKGELLKECLNEHPNGQAIVFSRTKHGAEKLMKHLVSCGYKADSIHGNKSQGQRERAIKAFREGLVKVLVATDVAARGIDIPNVTHVYNFDLPDVPENYVHRIGRTARAGKDGEAIAFVSSVEIKLLRQIQKIMKVTIPVASGIEPAAEDRPKRVPQQRQQRKDRPKKPAVSAHKPARDTQGKKRPARRPNRKPRQGGTDAPRRQA
ncbi:DEAD/DEAH box helicase [Cochlodiniinecator piscidefendens]|uniref:DEAD/DEAH box helicase n=1 Tax=Cochlodiniinecator piscidefendens TaxID=2715756 RepID=UPI001E5D58AB|nr:DEAD/DEAH box helicase [Cochlodiniinecator piscidefendens]